ncbi:bifunctional folylpolyglutamate synthase/ dihydrofolate synthase [Actinobacillus delphinicola]|uniref:Dihydrofolate synthase/folylpolyglutamate synthase n=2 Tax=Actinobacillus delphinicola TaxID=51161 RepID=A0A448TW95_9PAST|nr:bifunctional tetrahydrofolate synthase/dihydrofolate synthase [Actinobacillus delphinicola]VEJ10183.1 bifunctional folylpolyglutamate synthase/ dihydrofolate synthase [Actinobacillus delphinicola]
MQNHHPMILNEETPLSQWLSYLEQAHEKVIDLGLERVAEAARALNLTNIAPFVITVGGTNGKGTTCRLLEMLLLRAGYKVGVYSSPHLLHYRERVRINHQCLPDEEHCKSFNFIEKNKPNSLTYFEFGTLSAFNLFKKAKLDVVILEVGLGGRLDATNIIDSDVAVVTSIDIDHTAFLGNTREEIAFEKAGIFRANKPAIVGEPDAPMTLLNYANELNCKLFCRNRDWSFSETGDTWEWHSKNKQYKHLPKPTIPLANAATVIATLQSLPFSIGDEILKEVLETVELTGRFQTVSAELRQKIAQKYQLNETMMPNLILDVGHNPHAARYLSERITQLRKKMITPDFSGKFYALCGVLRDKDLAGILTPLIPVMDGWNCLTLNGERGQSGNVIAEKLKILGVDSPIKSFDVLDQGLSQILSELKREDTLIIFGSFHTVAEFYLLIEE